MFDITEHYDRIKDMKTGVHGETWIAKALNPAADNESDEIDSFIIKQIPKNFMNEEELPEKVLSEMQKIKKAQKTANDVSCKYLMRIHEIVEDDDNFYMVYEFPKEEG